MEIINNIENTIQDIQSFFSKNEIDFLQVRQKGNKYLIDFTINVLSFTSKTDYAKTFHFELELRTQKNVTLFEIYTREGGKIPFHPHFQISDKFSLSTLLTKQAKWIGYTGEEDIVSFTKRMILSLQFNKGYIIIEPDKIGNEDAKQWYLEENYKKDLST